MTTTTRDQVLQNLSTLKDFAKVYHQAKVLRACGLDVDGSDDSYHEHKVSELRQLLEQPAAAQPPTEIRAGQAYVELGDNDSLHADSTSATVADFAEPDTFDQDAAVDAE